MWHFCFAQRDCALHVQLLSKSKVQPYPRYVGGAFSSQHVSRESAFCFVFFSCFFLELKHSSEPPWQTGPLNPAGFPFLVRIPRTFCSTVGCPGLALAPFVLCGKVFMRLCRNERNKGSIHKPAQGYYRVSDMGLFSGITFISYEALKIKLKGFAKRKCLTFEESLRLLFTCVWFW